MGYNLLTLQLLRDGYTVENHPDYVQVDSSRLTGPDPLNNLGGGFVFKKGYLETMVFKTPCGYIVKGSNVFHNMFYVQEWQPENYNPVIVCPFARKLGFTCDKVHPDLWKASDSKGQIQFCSCSLTDEAYQYGKSIEKVRKDKEDEKHALYEKFVEERKGRVCWNHAHYDESTGVWSQHYSAEVCAHRCYSSFCPIRGRALNAKKGDVYYDVYSSGIYEDGIIIQEWKKAQKGLRFFKKAVSLDICESFVESGEARRAIEWEYRSNNSTEFLFDKSLRVEIRNIRAESRPSRNLEQDLADMKAGCYVSWNPADEKEAKAEKKKRRAMAAQKRKQKLEKRIVSAGFDGLTDIEKIRAERIFDESELEALEKRHQEEGNIPAYEQMNILDF